MNRITTVLFDLDGTLLPMDQDMFVKEYFSRLVAKMAGRGYDPGVTADAIWKGTAAMVRNDGSVTNEQAFWRTFAFFLGENVIKEEPILREFYKTEFQSVSKICGYTSEAATIIDDLRARGFRVVLATNPLFPAIATESRIRWAGLDPSAFEWITTYENSRYCKPNPAYYQEILKVLGVSGNECVMVGNDVSEDMVTEQLGMTPFLLTDCLINKENADISAWPNGSFDKLKAFLENI